MKKQITILLFAITVTTVVTISILSIPTAMALILRINTSKSAGSFLAVTGTSMPSNATDTMDVMFKYKRINKDTNPLVLWVLLEHIQHGKLQQVNQSK
ncbi:MAG: hypothetical protein DLM72_12415 [Candidatus Nitrosopolaris wilkensis]|nr:MAG: hypothetical protein DLM72_12415 [Candidatus Nitrosopolaris wilkensis]